MGRRGWVSVLGRRGRGACGQRRRAPAAARGVASDTLRAWRAGLAVPHTGRLPCLRASAAGMQAARSRSLRTQSAWRAARASSPASLSSVVLRVARAQTGRAPELHRGLSGFCRPYTYQCCDPRALQVHASRGMMRPASSTSLSRGLPARGPPVLCRPRWHPGGRASLQGGVAWPLEARGGDRRAQAFSRRAASGAAPAELQAPPVQDAQPWARLVAIMFASAALVNGARGASARAACNRLSAAGAPVSASTPGKRARPTCPLPPLTLLGPPPPQFAASLARPRGAAAATPPPPPADAREQRARCDSAPPARPPR